MGKDTAFAIEKLEEDQWRMEQEWIRGLLQEGFFHPLELLHYTPSHPVYGMARMSEFRAILCGDGNDEESWCVPITENFGLPPDLSDQVAEEFRNSSDPDNYGKPVCITLRQLIEYDLTSGWNNEKNKKEPFSPYVVKQYELLINELQKIGAPGKVRVVFWFF
jgi:hypothetical protein